MKRLILLVLAAALLLTACGGAGTKVPEVKWEEGIYDDAENYKTCLGMYRDHADALAASGEEGVTEVTSTGLLTTRSHIIVDKWDSHGILEYWTDAGVMKYDKIANTVTESGSMMYRGVMDEFARDLTIRLDQDNDFYDELRGRMEQAAEDGVEFTNKRYDQITGERIDG